MIKITRSTQFQKNIKNPDLQELSCMKLKLKELDLSRNIDLRILNAAYNDITNVDFTFNRKLEEVYLYVNSFTTLDFSKNRKLRVLWIDNNPDLLEVYVKRGLDIEIVKDEHTKIIEV